MTTTRSITSARFNGRLIAPIALTLAAAALPALAHSPPSPPSPARWMTLPTWPAAVNSGVGWFMQAPTAQGRRLLFQRGWMEVAELRVGEGWVDLPRPAPAFQDPPITHVKHFARTDIDVGRGPELSMLAHSNVFCNTVLIGANRRATAHWNGESWQLRPDLVDCTRALYPHTMAPSITGPRVFGTARQRPDRGVNLWQNGQWRISWPHPPGLASTSTAFLEYAFSLDRGTSATTYAKALMMPVPPYVGLAVFDGTAWAAADPTEVSGVGVFRVAVFDDGQGAAFYTASAPMPWGGLGHPQNRSVFRWRPGEGWSILYTYAPGNSTAEIHGMQVFDDGRGEALYIVGDFITFGGVPTRGLIRYDGKSFEGFEIFGYNAAGNPAPAWPMVLERMDTPMGPALVLVLGNRTGVTIGGGFVQTGLVALLSGHGCYANCDGSGPNTTLGGPVLSPADFVCFLNKFRARDPYANCDASPGLALPGVATSPALTPEDFICFLNKFRAGCP